MDANLSVLSEGSKGELVYGTYPVLKGMGWEEQSRCVEFLIILLQIILNTLSNEVYKKRSELIES
jgi:hypothetical protein